MPPVKIVVSGPVGAGKTTFVDTLTRSRGFHTEALASEAIGKAHTTVALDYGWLDLDGREVHLFGTPGQDRFDFMWDVLSEGAGGLLLLVAADKAEQVESARRILAHLQARGLTAFLVGANRGDAPGAIACDALAVRLGVPEDAVEAVDARDEASCRRAVEALLHRMMAFA